MKRTLSDAQLRSPRKAVLTYINNQIGAQVGKGSQVAILSDLSHFKVDGEIADSYSSYLATGGKAIVTLEGKQLQGTVSSVTPLSQNGVISFSVLLENDHHKSLRSGLKADIHIIKAVKDKAMRIANSSYYRGKGKYELFVIDGDELVKRWVELGDSNFEYVEVLSGLKPGDRIVISDMNAYKGKKRLKID